MATRRICSVEGCGKRHEGLGYCSAHWERFKRYGDPLAGGVTPGSLMAFIVNEALPCESTECLHWPFGKAHGRGRIKYAGRLCFAHRVVCELAHGAAPSSRHEAAHSCGNGHVGCVNPRHLRWATRQENEHDKFMHGTHNKGARHGCSKLTEAEASEILSLKGSFRQREVAARFGVHRSTVSLIHSGRLWGHLPRPQTSAGSSNSVSTATSETRTPRTPRS